MGRDRRDRRPAEGAGPRVKSDCRDVATLAHPVDARALREVDGRVAAIPVRPAKHILQDVAEAFNLATSVRGKALGIARIRIRCGLHVGGGIAIAIEAIQRHVRDADCGEGRVEISGRKARQLSPVFHERNVLHVPPDCANTGDSGASTKRHTIMIDSMARMRALNIGHHLLSVMR